MCLKFAVEYVKFIISIFRNNYRNQPPLMDVDLTETFICLKSSFTYAAKLLSLLLRSNSADSQLLHAPFDLANELFNLVASVEEFFGYGQAARLITAVKPWVPDLILALGSGHLLKQTGSTSGYDKSPLPMWATVLAKIELYELQGIVSDKETVRVSKREHSSGFKKLALIMVQLLKANSKVLDAVGVIFLKGSLVGLERKNFDLVLGLLHFVCMKLARDEEWEELKLMLESIHGIYPRLEIEAKQQSNSEDEREMLKSAKALLEPVWMHRDSGEQKTTMEE